MQVMVKEDFMKLNMHLTRVPEIVLPDVTHKVKCVSTQKDSGKCLERWLHG